SGKWSNNGSLSGVATGSVNDTAFGNTAIKDPLNNNSALAADTFGEAAINLSALFALLPPTEDPCVHFASVYLKSRSSASFTAELKDFIAPMQAGVVIFNPNAVAAAQTLLANRTSGGSL